MPKGEGDGSGHRYTGPFTVIVRDAEHPDHQGHAARVDARPATSCTTTCAARSRTSSVLATAYSQGRRQRRHEPMIWTVSYGKGRVFHTPMGHDVDRHALRRLRRHAPARHRMGGHRQGDAAAPEGLPHREGREAHRLKLAAQAAPEEARAPPPTTAAPTAGTGPRRRSGRGTARRRRWAHSPSGRCGRPRHAPPSRPARRSSSMPQNRASRQAPAVGAARSPRSWSAGARRVERGELGGDVGELILDHDRARSQVRPELAAQRRRRGGPRVTVDHHEPHVGEQVEQSRRSGRWRSPAKNGKERL